MYADSKGSNNFTKINTLSNQRVESPIIEGLKDFSIDTKNKRIGLLSESGNIGI